MCVVIDVGHDRGRKHGGMAEKEEKEDRMLKRMREAS